MVGVVSLVLPKLNIFPNHHDITYVFVITAYTVEALLFKFHLYGRESVDVLVHTLLLYSVYGCVIATAAEMRNRESILAVMGRAFFTMLQGTWFWQAGFILFPPLSHPWGGADSHEGHDHEYMMIITCAFIWHMAAILLLMLAVGSFIGCYYKRRGLLDGSKSFEMEGRKYPSSQGYTVLDVEDKLSPD